MKTLGLHFSLARKCGFKIRSQASINGFLCQLHNPGCVFRYSVRQVQDRRHELIVRDHTIHQTDPLCFLGGNHRTRKYQLTSVCAANYFGEKPASAPIRVQTDAREAGTERGGIGCNPDITAQRKTEPRARTWTVDGRDDGLPKRSHPAGYFLSGSENGSN